MNRLIHSKTAIVALLGAMACFAVSPQSVAVSPPPDGGYPNQNTAEGENALFSLTSGRANTAVGYRALYSDTSGQLNTAVGFRALDTNTQGTSNTAIGVAALIGNTTGGANTATTSTGPTSSISVTATSPRRT